MITPENFQSLASLALRTAEPQQAATVAKLYRHWGRRKSLSRVREPHGMDNRMKTKTIELSEPVKDHRSMIKKIVLREPQFSDFITLGMPSVWVSLADGGGFSLASLCLRDTLALRGAVLGFFIEAVMPAQTADADQSLASDESLPSNASSTLGPSTI
jgi:hypothetical protein